MKVSAAHIVLALVLIMLTAMSTMRKRPTPSLKLTIPKIDNQQNLFTGKLTIPKIDEQNLFTGNFDAFPKRNFNEVYSYFNETLKWACPEEVLVYKFNIEIGERYDTLNELYMPELSLAANSHESNVNVFAHNGDRYLPSMDYSFRSGDVYLYETKVYLKSEFQEVFTLLCRYLEAERIKREVSGLVDSLNPLLNFQVGGYSW